MSEAGSRPAQPDFRAFKNGLVAVHKTYEALFPLSSREDEMDPTYTFEEGLTLRVEFVGEIEAEPYRPNSSHLNGKMVVNSIDAESIALYWPNQEFGDGTSVSLQFYGTAPDGTPIYIQVPPEKIAGMELIGPNFEAQPKTYELLSDLQGKRALVDLLKEAGSYDGNCFTLGDGNYLQVIFKSPVAITYFDKDDEPIGEEEQVTSFSFNEIIATDNRLEGGVITLIDLSDESRTAALEEVSLDDIESIVLVINSQNGDDV